MRVLPVLLVFFGFTLAYSTATAASPTPTVSPDRTEITVNFVSHGQPAKVYVAMGTPEVIIDDVICDTAGPAAGGMVDHVVFYWWKGAENQPANCKHDPPVKLVAQWVVENLSKVNGTGRFAVVINWTGDDTSVNLDVTSFLDGSKGVLVLPDSGGVPASRNTPWTILGIGAAFIAVGGTLLALSKRSA